MSRPAPFHVFTPQRDQPAELEKILVKRHALLDSAVGKVRESVISPDKHRLLFIGPRGMGKSYLVTLIHHRLSMQEDLEEKMRFAWLNEDQTSTTFLHLLMRIYRKLAEQNPKEFPIGELDAIRGKEPADAREILGQSLIRHLKSRTVVLLIENLDAIFNSMSEVEQRTWRGFIQDHPSFAIVATAQGLTKDISSKAKPFFGFFEIHHLEPLTVDEAAELLEKIAVLNDDQPLAEFIASSRGKARMRAIHHLSGGNPRLYLILSDFLTKDSLDNLVRLFEETVDRQLTPYFQERMRWLSPQQQEIVQFLCQQVHPASVKSISEGIFTKQNTVSGQLKQLREKGYLVSKGRGKESLYELAEPLMRLSFQVKEMNHRQPLTLIVDFMRVWYDRQDLEKRLEGILPGTWGRDYFEVAIYKIDTEGNAFRHSLMLACIDDIDWQKCDARQLGDLRGIAEETESPDAWFKYGCACLTSEEFGEGIRAMSQLIGSTSSEIPYFDTALLCRAVCHLKSNQFEEAIADYTAAMELPDISEESFAQLAYGRAKALWMKKDSAAAIADLTRAINGWKGDPESVANALVLRGEWCSEMGLYEEALSDLGRAVEMLGIPEAELANALAKRAYLFDQLKRYAEALSDSERVAATPGVAPGPLAQALNVRALCRMRNGDILGAKSDLDIVCSLPESPRIWLASAYLFRSAVFRRSGDIQKAVADLSTAAETLQAFAPYALSELAKLYIELHQYEQSLDAVIRLQACPKPTGMQEIDQVDLGIILTEAAYGLREIPEKWTSATKQILPLLAERDFTTGLSTALVRHLEKLKQSDHNNAALDRWVTDWENVSRDYPELQVGIRMLRSGVEWIKTENDGALLDLVKEERVIVRQALGLEPEEEE
jgi:tetratricopeptide (TPR) repeat protein